MAWVCRIRQLNNYLLGIYVYTYRKAWVGKGRYQQRVPRFYFPWITWRDPEKPYWDENVYLFGLASLDTLDVMTMVGLGRKNM